MANTNNSNNSNNSTASVDQIVLSSMNVENEYKNVVRLLADRSGLTRSQVSASLRRLKKCGSVQCSAHYTGEKPWIPTTEQAVRARRASRRAEVVARQRAQVVRDELRELGLYSSDDADEFDTTVTLSLEQAERVLAMLATGK